MINLEWRTEAACRFLDPALFFIERGAVVSEVAVNACQTCPVASECYVHALRHEAYGYWAGTSERQRKTLRRAAGIRFEGLPRMFWEEHGTESAYKRHRRADEPACSSCRQAKALAEAERKEAS